MQRKKKEKRNESLTRDVYIVISKYVIIIIQDYLDNKLITIMTLEMHRLWFNFAVERNYPWVQIPKW